MRQQRRDVEQVGLGDRHPQADGAADRTAIDLGGGGFERQPDALGDGEAFVAAGIIDHDGEFLAAETPDQVAGAELGVGRFGENLQHMVAHGVAEAIVDRLEVVEIGEQHRGRTAFRLLPLAQRHDLFKERPAVGNAGERIDQRRGLVAQLGALLRHGE